MDKDQIYQILKKVGIILFSFLVFAYMLRTSKGEIHALTAGIFAVLLLQILAYIDILILRDQIWVLEGSLKMVRDLRDAFLEPAGSATQMFNKIWTLLNTIIVFVIIGYLQKNSLEAQGFIAVLMIILLIIVLLYEAMVIRLKLERIFEILEKYKNNISTGIIPDNDPASPETTPAPSGEDQKPLT